MRSLALFPNEVLQKKVFCKIDSKPIFEEDALRLARLLIGKIKSYPEDQAQVTLQQFINDALNNPVVSLPIISSDMNELKKSSYILRALYNSLHELVNQNYDEIPWLPKWHIVPSDDNTNFYKKIFQTYAYLAIENQLQTPEVDSVHSLVYSKNAYRHYQWCEFSYKYLSPAMMILCLATILFPLFYQHKKMSSSEGFMFSSLALGGSSILILAPLIYGFLKAGDCKAFVKQYEQVGRSIREALGEDLTARPMTITVKKSSKMLYTSVQTFFAPPRQDLINNRLQQPLLQYEHNNAINKV